MMKQVKKKPSFWIWPILLLPVIALFFWSCAPQQEPGKVPYIKEGAIPRKIAVLPAKFLYKGENRKDLKEEAPDKQAGTEDKGPMSMRVDPESDKGRFVAGLIRGVINNQLNGKGYSTQVLASVDRRLESLKGKTWEKASYQELCRALEVDGLVYPEIVSAVMLKAVAYNEYSVEARIKMVNHRGKVLGTWTDSASKRKIAIPTSPLSAAAVVLEAVMDESERKHMRLVIYDLGWKITQFVPDSPHREALPEIISVDTNIDRGVFGAGEQIEVEINAEKGLRCTFDLGDFKKGIPIPYRDGGIYKGVYTVREGDRVANVPIKIRMVKPNGVERLWVETGGTVTIDATAPPAPKRLKAGAGRQGVSLTWSIPPTEDLNEFVVEKGDRPVGEFQVLAKTKDQGFLDAGVTQGSVHYYRIRSVDKTGNRSRPTRAVKVIMPHFDEVKLPKICTGTLVPGVYLISEPSLVPEGEILEIGPGSSLNFSPGARLMVEGTLKIAGTEDRSVILKGKDWKGIYVVPGGRADISHASLQDCNPCVQAAGGNVEARSTTVKGKGGDGVTMGQGSRFVFDDLLIGGFHRGIVLDGANGRMVKSTVTGNRVGLDFAAGNVELINNNIYGNREEEVLSRSKLVLYGNYLGAKTERELRLEGDILVKSLLDAPYPHGRKIVLVEEKEMTPEAVEARFQEQKGKGIEAFTKRRFGQAHQFLSRAMSLKDDNEVYLYLAYTQMNMGEDEKAEKTLEKGIKVFPYEVRFYQIYARHLASKGRKDQALALLEKALRMNPDNETLKMMKEGLARPAAAPVKKAEAKKQAPPEEQRPGPGKKGPVTEPEKAPRTVPREKTPDLEKMKSKGIAAFKEKRFKDADGLFRKALSIRDDKDVYLYLAYTQINLGQSSKAEKTLEKGLKAFPQEVRLYRIYAKYLASSGQTQKAVSIVKKGLQIAPDDSNLKFMNDYLKGR
ncbi:MAG: tetratricopeptide repeat protein [Deltaproteobacteria bacterium]|nr:tetratricopeptide repeat protein [Deltaproteobacteria bacterium]MBW2047178.1 tetratricopeptide repeat protein [Deltaproteobacteria bacterium]MBW2109855.1 tetratricopeptide repeat protein [Deltaproteobacteria bacterium]HDZ91323.1 tetratricopeptide repeat protein [Deltaproteobacteria bacterium]